MKFDDIKIKSRIISENEPIFITAETGVTCNYDMNISKELIDVVAESGADAIKFIFWFPEEIMADRSVVYEYSTVNGKQKENMFDMISKLQFSLDEWQELKSYADKKDVIFFSSISTPSGILYSEKLDLDVIKIGSWEFNNIPLWKDVVKLGKPVVIDTGPASVYEIMNVMKVIEENNIQALLVHNYHTDNYEEMNMNSIPYLKSTFRTHVGFSAPNYHSEMDIIALSLGSSFLEKRLTLSRSLPGHHHCLSMEPKEFSNYVSMMRNLQKSLGGKYIKPTQNDLKERKSWFRSLVANKSITAGTVITEDLIACKRPGKGIDPEHVNFFLGKTLKRDLEENDLFEWKDV